MRPERIKFCSLCFLTSHLTGFCFLFAMMLKRLSKVLMLCLLHSLVCATTQTLEESRQTCNRTDLVIVLDSSYSVKTAQFEQAKSFLIKMVNNLTVSQEDVRVAVVRYENDVDVILSLNNSSDASIVEEAISSMEHKAKPGTHTGKALKEVREKVLERDIKGEKAKRVVMTITDGESTDFDETEYQATQLRNDGVRLVWLFVFENSNSFFEQMNYEKREMEKNGDPTVTVTRFDDLGDDLVSKMLEISCQDLTSDTPTTAVPETSTVLDTLFPETSSSSTRTAPVTATSTTTRGTETTGTTTVSVTKTSALVTVFPETSPSPTKAGPETASAATTAPWTSVSPATSASETSSASKTNFPESSTISANSETSTQTTTLLSEIFSRPTTNVPETSSHPAAVIPIITDTATTHDTLATNKETSTNQPSVNETSLPIEDSENATEAQPLQMADAFTGATENLPKRRSKAGITDVTESAWRLDADGGNHTKSEQPSPEIGSTSTAFTVKSTLSEKQKHGHEETVTTSSNDSGTEKGQEWPIYAGVGSGSAAVAMATAGRVLYGLWRRKKLLMSNDIEMQKIT